MAKYTKIVKQCDTCGYEYKPSTVRYCPAQRKNKCFYCCRKCEYAKKHEYSCAISCEYKVSE